MSSERMTAAEFHAIPPSKPRSVRAVGEAVLATREAVKSEPGQRKRKPATIKPPTESYQQSGQWILCEAKKPNKYGAKKVTTDEGVFDSKIEYKRWCELKQLRDLGLIANLERQIPYLLEVNGVKIGRFTADHRWRDSETGAVIVEDVKGGVCSRDFPLRVKLMKAVHGVDVQVWPERKRKARKATKR